MHRYVLLALTAVIIVVSLSLLTRLLLWMRHVARFGTYVQAKKQGMTDEQARAYVAATRHMYKEDHAYNAFKVEKAQTLGLEHLIRELTAPFKPNEFMEDLLNHNGLKQRRRDEALEEFLRIVSQREEIAAVLASHGYIEAAGKEKLSALYDEFERKGAGPRERLAALYKPDLLALVLKAQADGKNPVFTIFHYFPRN